ncbi:MAG: S41 family peptidase [Dysgonamonadaceae bacterium]|jgi:carboxyl-terminal processing protease|nr:S41 family peptidase [Dysgonamonadaceae bacterium]
MKPKKMTGWMIIAIAISLVTGITIGNFVSVHSFGRKWFLTPHNKMNVMLDVIHRDYVDTVDMKEVTENAIRNIIGELDPHSTYISGRDAPALNEDMDGRFGGIGVDYFIYNDTIVIINLTYGGPSSQAGLLPGDRIVTVNHSDFTGTDVTEEKILQVMRGPVGSSVHLGIRRNASDSLIEYTIRRAEILIPTVCAAYEVDKGVGFIKIQDKFSHTTYDEFVQAMTQLVSQDCRSFIIDLRGNSGGAYEAAIQIINEFLPAGRMIVYAEGKSFPHNESVADGSGNLPDCPLVILIDQLSASASEIVAGAIQDNDRGLIIGRRSFGKGLVQNQIDFSDGSAVRLTIARYYTPSGRNIQRKYELGKTNDYNREWLNQFNNGESFYRDSIKVDTTKEYKTLHGRTVYGNSGILPDIFIPIDTAHLTNYYIQLENKNVFNQFAFEYSDRNRAVLSRFTDFPSMLDYLQTQILLEDVVGYAEANGIRKRTMQIRRSANQILATTYACIIRNFFGDNAFFQIYMNNDPMIQRAVQAIRNGEASPEAVAAMKYQH